MDDFMPPSMKHGNEFCLPFCYWMSDRWAKHGDGPTKSEANGRDEIRNFAEDGTVTRFHMPHHQKYVSEEIGFSSK